MSHANELDALPRVETLSLTAAAAVQSEYVKLARSAAFDIARATDRGHLYPLGGPTDLEWVRTILDREFAELGFDLFERRVEPPPRVPLTQPEKDAIYARDGRRCRWCGTSDALVIDHIHPVRYGGTNDPENLQVLCVSCNSWKQAKVGQDQ